MEAFKTEAEVSENGTVTLHGVPFRTGERVEVIVLHKAAAPAGAEERYPLRGTAYRFEDPFTPPVAEDEWEALH